jgi:hypothetical protein
MSRVKIDPIKVEKYGVNEEHELHIDGDKEWKDYQGSGASKLVDIFVRNHTKRSWVEEDMVMTMDTPKWFVYVPQAMIKPLVKVRTKSYPCKLSDMIQKAFMVFLGEGTVSLRHAM